MSKASSNDFLVVKFVGMPRVLGNIPYKCIHKSWIVTRTGNNVMVACPVTHSVKVAEVFSATLEYETGRLFFPQT